MITSDDERYFNPEAGKITPVAKGEIYKLMSSANSFWHFTNVGSGRTLSFHCERNNPYTKISDKLLNGVFHQNNKTTNPTVKSLKSATRGLLQINY